MIQKQDHITHIHNAVMVQISFRLIVDWVRCWIAHVAQKLDDIGHVNHAVTVHITLLWRSLRPWLQITCPPPTNQSSDHMGSHWLKHTTGKVAATDVPVHTSSSTAASVVIPTASL